MDSIIPIVARQYINKKSSVFTGLFYLQDFLKPHGILSLGGVVTL